MSIRIQPTNKNSVIQNKFREDLRIYFLNFLLLFLLSPLSGNAIADDIFDVGSRITTSKSIINARKGSKKECLKLQNYDECQLLEINGKVIISEYYVSINSAFPNKFNPSIIFATGSTGGNACCENHYLIDLSKEKPLVLSVEALPKPYLESPKINSFSSGITFENYGEGKGEFGEALWNTYRYLYGSGKIETIKSLPKLFLSSMDKKEYSGEVLDDPVSREIFLKIMGKSNYLEFRSRFEVQFELQKHSSDLYSGGGCTPHLCGIEEGFFVIDNGKKNAWAMYIFDDKGIKRGLFFGNIDDDFNKIRNIFNAWLINNKTNWNQVKFVGVNSDTNGSSSKPISGGLPPIKIIQN